MERILVSHPVSRNLRVCFGLYKCTPYFGKRSLSQERKQYCSSQVRASSNNIGYDRSSRHARLRRLQYLTYMHCHQHNTGREYEIPEPRWRAHSAHNVPSCKRMAAFRTGLNTSSMHQADSKHERVGTGRAKRSRTLPAGCALKSI